MRVIKKEKGKEWEEEVKKNLILAERGEPLTCPLSLLNSFSDFKKEWIKLQIKLHGITKEDKIYNKKYYEKNKDKIITYMKTPKVKLRQKKWRNKPEVKARKKEYDKIYKRKKELEKMEKEKCQ